MANLYEVLNAHKQNRNDKRVFGLVLQSGGMRACYSAGAMIPLIEYGFDDAFEHVIGASAGAINGAYFITRQIGDMHTYTNDLTTKHFVNLRRKEKKIDIDYLVDEVIKPRHPFNMDDLLVAHAKLHTILTDAETGEKVVASDRRELIQIYEEFRATAALPILYDKTVKIGGRYFLDGGVADMLPVDVAIDLGCTDIVIVMTQRAENYNFDTRHRRLAKRLVRQLAKNQSEAVKLKLPTDDKLLQANLRIIKNPGKKINIYLLQPSDPEALINMSTIERDKVQALTQLGVVDMDTFLYQTV